MHATAWNHTRLICFHPSFWRNSLLLAHVVTTTAPCHQWREFPWYQATSDCCWQTSEQKECGSYHGFWWVLKDPWKIWPHQKPSQHHTLRQHMLQQLVPSIPNLKQLNCNLHPTLPKHLHHSKCQPHAKQVQKSGHPWVTVLLPWSSARGLPLGQPQWHLQGSHRQRQLQVKILLEKGHHVVCSLLIQTNIILCSSDHPFSGVNCIWRKCCNVLPQLASPPSFRLGHFIYECATLLAKETCSELATSTFVQILMFACFRIFKETCARFVLVWCPQSRHVLTWV